MAKSLEARLQRLETHVEQRRAASSQPSGEEWLQAAQSDDLSYAGWMEARGYSQGLIATVLARRTQAEETLRLFDDSPDDKCLAYNG